MQIITKCRFVISNISDKAVIGHSISYTSIKTMFTHNIDNYPYFVDRSWRHRSLVWKQKIRKFAADKNMR